MGIGETLKRARERAGLTQKQLAEMLFVDASLVSRWEKNQRRIPLVTFVQILDILELNLEDFDEIWEF